MRQLKFTYRGKEYHLILRECPDNVSTDILEKVAIHCYRNLAERQRQKSDAQFFKNIASAHPHYAHNESRTYTIIIKRLWVRENDNPIFQFAYSDDDQKISDTLISSADLKTVVPVEFTFDHAMPNLSDDDLPGTFLRTTEDTNEWVLHPPILKRLFEKKSKLPITLEPIPFIDEVRANTTPYDQTVDQLCHKLQLSDEDRQLAQHLITKNLRDEFTALAKDPDLLTTYDDWVESELRQHPSVKVLPVSDLPILQIYIQKQIKLAQAKIAEIKANATANYTNNNLRDTKYQQKIADLQLRDYLDQLNKLHYVRTNIMIALYNAACLAYNALIQKYNDSKAKDHEKLKADIAHFNNAFKNVAQIQPDTLRLTSLQILIKHLSSLPSLSKQRSNRSLEAFVNLVLDDAAKDKTAFALLKQQLENFQEQISADQEAARPILFNEICNPASKSITDVIREKLGSDNNKEVTFELTPALCAWESNLDELEKQFPNHLDVIKSMLAAFKIELSEILNTREPELDEYFAKQRNNIHALHRTLETAARINGRIDNLLDDSANIQLTLNSFHRKFRKFDAIVAKYAIPQNELISFRKEFLGSEAWDEPETLLDSIAQIRERLYAARSEAEKIEALTSESEPLDKNGINQHLFALITIEIKSIDQCAADAEVIKSQIKSRSEDNAELRNWAYVSKHIDIYLPLMAKYESAIKDLVNYTARINEISNYSYIYTKNSDYTASLQSLAFLKKQVQDYNEAITNQITALAKVTSENNGIVTVLKNKQLQAKQNADAALENHNKDIYDLARCNLAMNAIFDFEYWQRAASIWDSKVQVRDARTPIGKAGSYKIPDVIFTLVHLSSRNNCKNWDVNPDHARQLMTEMRDALTNAETEKHLTRFKEIVCEQVIHDAKGAVPDLNSLEQPRLHLAQLTRKQPPAPLQRKPAFQKLTMTPSFFEKSPYAYRILTGVIVGVVLAAAVTLICVGLIYGGAAPLLATGVGAVMTLGGPGLVSFCTIVMAAIIAGISAAINLMFDCGRKPPKPAHDRTIIDIDSALPVFSANANMIDQPPQGQSLSIGLSARFLSKSGEQAQPEPEQRRMLDL